MTGEKIVAAMISLRESMQHKVAADNPQPLIIESAHLIEAARAYERPQSKLAQLADLDLSTFPSRED